MTNTPPEYSAPDDDAQHPKDADAMAALLWRILDDALAIERTGITIEPFGPRTLRLTTSGGDRFKLTVVKKR